MSTAHHAPSLGAGAGHFDTSDRRRAVLAPTDRGLRTRMARRQSHRGSGRSGVTRAGRTRNSARNTDPVPLCATSTGTTRVTFGRVAAEWTTIRAGRSTERRSETSAWPRASRARLTSASTRPTRHVVAPQVGRGQRGGRAARGRTTGTPASLPASPHRPAGHRTICALSYRALSTMAFGGPRS